MTQSSGGRAWSGRVAVVAGLVALAALLVPGVAGAAGTSPPQRPEVFSARIVGVDSGGAANRPAQLSYTVRVLRVYGESTVDRRRAVVTTSPQFARCRDRPTRAAAASDGPAYFFVVDKRRGRLLADACGDVARVTRDGEDAVVSRFGPAHAPGTPVPEQPGEQGFGSVAYGCPASEDTVSDVERASEQCAAVEPPDSLRRTAAPGLALVIVGLLGLLVVRRLARPTAGR